MERDLATELDHLKEEIQTIKRMLIRNLPKTEPKVPGNSREKFPPESLETLNTLRDQLLVFTENPGETGAIAYTGTFQSGDAETTQQSIWASLVPTNELLTLNEHRMVEKVLTSLGNSHRLAILLALLKRPMTVSQLMETTGANTTGQIYHHLKPLVSADIVKEEKGVFCVIPYRVQGIILVLAGVCDLVDPRYTSGTWEEQAS